MRRIGPYTALQFVEIAAFAVVAVFGVLAHHPSMASIGIGLLVSKAVANSLPPRFSVVQRGLVGYGLGLVLAAAVVLVIRFVVL
ncbi:MAG TPA: hypothetical protein VG245_01390 [Candidatus Dormibacteraeota bacterium]|jgi:hypothetical protein|nr:hypothetical protein [Candidatus Dormibacteraeota bacterium]